MVRAGKEAGGARHRPVFGGGRTGEGGLMLLVLLDAVASLTLHTCALPCPSHECPPPVSKKTMHAASYDTGFPHLTSLAASLGRARHAS